VLDDLNNRTNYNTLCDERKLANLRRNRVLNDGNPREPSKL